MKMHLRYAQGIGQLWFERLELGRGLPRLREQARIDVCVHERRMDARERVRIPEPLTLDLPEQRLEHVDLVAHVTERVEASGLSRDGIDPRGRWFIPEDLLRERVPPTARV